MHSTFEKYVFGQFGLSRTNKAPVLDCPENLKAIGCIIGERDIVVSQLGLVTGRSADLHFVCNSKEIREYASRDFSGHPQSLLDKRVIQFLDYSAFLGLLLFEGQDYLIFVKEAALRLMFDKDMIYSVESVEAVRIADSRVEPKLTSHLNEVFIAHPALLAEHFL